MPVAAWFIYTVEYMPVAALFIYGGTYCSGGLVYIKWDI
jgi:hypothetical protein